MLQNLNFWLEVGRLYLWNKSYGSGFVIKVPLLARSCPFTFGGVFGFIEIGLYLKKKTPTNARWVFEAKCRFF